MLISVVETMVSFSKLLFTIQRKSMLKQTKRFHLGSLLTKKMKLLIPDLSIRLVQKRAFTWPTKWKSFALRKMIKNGPDQRLHRLLILKLFAIWIMIMLLVITFIISIRQISCGHVKSQTEIFKINVGL